MRIVFLGLSITSSWENPHATNYRALLRALRQRGHDTLFLGRDVPWHAVHRDVLGSCVPGGVAVADWLLETARGATAFYDLDTPATLAQLDAGDEEYLSAELVPRFDLYLSLTGGPESERMEREYGARLHAFHPFVDAEAYRLLPAARDLDLGYLGTYCDATQHAVERLPLDPAHWTPARRFAMPAARPAFYARQRFTLDTGADTAGAPSVRLLEAAACRVPVISDAWEGLAACFEPGREILAASTADDVLDRLALPDAERDAIGRRARERVLRKHTAAHRARELERHVAALAHPDVSDRGIRAKPTA